jgi:FKBP12-rapamycin complex-associated protein
MIVGNMVRIAGITLGESFFTKEVGQALQMMDGTLASLNSVSTD